MGGPLVERLRWMAAACTTRPGLRSPLYAALLGAAADDVEARGPAYGVLAGHEDDPAGSALPLRLTAALHRLVLEGRAPELAGFFPTVGGADTPTDAWPAARRVLAEQRDAVRAYLDLPCQTNEVGRAAVLLTGLLHVASITALPIRLLEVGTSAGLNLRADAYRYVAPHGAWGPADSPVVVVDPWDGETPDLTVTVRVVDRAGCDPAPLDPASPEGRIRLESSVWGDQPARLHRLRAACAVAARIPATVETAGAADWLADRLGVPVEGAATVVWHSVVWQYLDPAELASAEAVLAAAGKRATVAAPIVRLAMEYDESSATGFPLWVTTWPGGVSRRLADASGHGPPVRLR